MVMDDIYLAGVPYYLTDNQDFKEYNKQEAGISCRTVRCKECDSNHFIVGEDVYHTAIKCSVCGWTHCLADG